MLRLALSSVVSSLLVLSSSVATAYDRGYGSLPQAMTDVNGDGVLDYCRFVGNSPEIFIACDLGDPLGEAGQYDYQSVRGIDWGYDTMPRFFADANGDGMSDYCRCVGDAPYIFMSCNLAREVGFDENQYTYTQYEWTYYQCW